MNIVLSASFGILAGAVWGIGYFLRSVTNFNRIATVAFDIIFSLMCGAIFLYCIFIVEAGYFRLYDIIAFALGFGIERISMGNLFASLIQNLYNRLHERKLKHADKKGKTNC